MQKFGPEIHIDDISHGSIHEVHYSPDGHIEVIMGFDYDRDNALHYYVASFNEHGYCNNADRKFTPEEAIALFHHVRKGIMQEAIEDEDHRQGVESIFQKYPWLKNGNSSRST